MRKHAKHLLVLGGAAAVLGILAWPERPPLAAVALPPDENLCAQEAVPTRAEGTALSTLTSAGLEGMTYDTVTGTLQLSQSSGGGGMRQEGLSLDDVFIACAGDFNEDGWTDFIGADYSGSDHAGVGFLKLFVNQTTTTAVPDWSDSNQSRDPSFVQSTIIEPSSPKAGAGALLCGDINADGHMDVLILRCTYGKFCSNPARADAFLGHGDGNFDPKYQFLNTLSIGGYISDDGARMVLYDVNSDGRKDLVVGAGGTLGGVITAYLNDGATPPKFVTAQTLVPVAGAASPAAGVSTLAIADFTNDGKADLVYGAIDSPSLTLITGTDTGFNGATQDIPFPEGYAVNIYSGDFARAGRADLFVVSDGPKAFMYANDGDSQPFSGGPTVTMAPGGSISDTFDAAAVLNYDNDPQNTPDLLVANGDQESQAYIFANRPGATLVDCGRATSGQIPTPELATVDGTVTAVRLSPEPAAPAEGTWTFWASNDNGTTWHPAPPCADDPTDYCADVSSTTGTTVRWRVEMCSNVTQTAAPTMSAVETKYTYVLATTHFRAGPVMRDDVIYVGAVREPGHEGKFLAIDNESGTVLWDAAEKLDAMTKDQRHIFSQRDDGTRIDVQALSSLPDMIDVLGVADLLQGGSLIDWLTSKRFGTVAPRTLGGILNSTAAVLSSPGRPYFFDLAATLDSERALITQHVEDFANRQNLVFVGSQTGMLHAFYTNPTDPSDPKNGKEAWAWVPRSVSLRLLGDKTSGAVTAYVDGSPTLATVKLGGAYRSVLVMGEGTGGDEVYALDVTETVDSSGTVLGPTFLWRFTDSMNMGDTISKPAVIRTLIGGVETWLAVFASGPDNTGDKGDALYAVDMATGALKWKFDIGDTDTYISTDITAVDEENGDPDGYISRLYFGDSKGRVWKIDPAVFTGTTASPVSSTVNVGLGANALFSTRLTAEGLGEDRAISANIIAVPDAFKRVVLYFGTGGTAETAPGEINAFYAVYGDTGAIRSKLDITGSRYNGASYQDGQIVFAQSEIPATVGPCVVSDSQIVAIDAQTFALQFFQEFEGRIASPVYITGGEIFAVTVVGKLVTSQYTGTNAPAPAALPGPPAGPVELNEPGTLKTGFTILGWRQTY